MASVEVPVTMLQQDRYEDLLRAKNDEIRRLREALRNQQKGILRLKKKVDAFRNGSAMHALLVQVMKLREQLLDERKVSRRRLDLLERWNRQITPEAAFGLENDTRRELRGLNG